MKMKALLLSVILSLSCLTSCSMEDFDIEETTTESIVTEASTVEETESETTEETTETTTTEEITTKETTTEEPTTTAPVLESSITLDEIPEYSGDYYYVVNNNVPFFTNYTTEVFETYSDLDSLGRCGVAYANICKEIMPTEERGEIGSVKPSGWHSVKYDWVDGKYLYNRCHLIGFQLAGENANEKNLITGTRSMNVDGMLPFENMIDDYVDETNNHVMYRVTPMYNGDDLVAKGVLMEAYSVEDNGEGVEFNVFCYNAEPGVTIDYATGDSYADGTVTEEPATTEAQTKATQAQAQVNDNSNSNQSQMTYILNTNTGKFHYPTCSSVDQMSDSNKQEYTGSRDDLVAQGYSPCGRCNP